MFGCTLLEGTLGEVKLRSLIVDGEIPVEVSKLLMGLTRDLRFLQKCSAESILCVICGSHDRKVPRSICNYWVAD